MPNPRRVLSALAVASLLAGACDAGPSVTADPGRTVAPSLSPTPAVTEAPFTAAAWPPDSSSCEVPGYTGRLGRIETPDERTVVFTLCEPDGAFPARLAHPALSIVDAAAVARLAEDPASGRALAGTGPYRIVRWVPGENVELSRVDVAPGPESVTPTVIVAWEADAATRTAALEEAAVDGIDAPGAAQLQRIATQPEVVVTPRPLLGTAFLAFGSGPGFTGTRVRRAIAASLDRAALTAAAFPAGSVAPTHVTPCSIPGACGGRAWYGFNAPAGVASLETEGFDLERTYLLRVPDAPVAGLPDPLATAEAVGAQLTANLGMRIEIQVMPSAEFRASVTDGSLQGLYLDSVTSSLADPSGFLEPLFGSGLRTTPARRSAAVAPLLLEAAASADPAIRAEAFVRANDAIRSAAAIVPLAHPGEVAAWRSDVAGVVVSSLGLDALGAVTPGDRPQLVFLQATEPAGAWCGDQASLDAVRLCGLVLEGLYGFAPGGLAARPALASGCAPDATATTWTCTLAAGRTFSDGATVDAGDVLATFVAQWDATSALRTSRPDSAFAAWDELFGATSSGG